jgi:hypothetical protein
MVPCHVFTRADNAIWIFHCNGEGRIAFEIGDFTKTNAVDFKTADGYDIEVMSMKRFSN